MLYLCVLFCKKETMSSKKIEIPRKKVVFFLAALMWCCVSFAVPSRRGWEQHFSTDGTSVELQQQGDECYHYWETRDGKLALPLGNNLFELTDANTPTPAQVAARRAGSPYYTRDARKIGAINMAPRGLVILVAYADLPYCAENTQSAIDSMMNHPGYSYNGATGSARDYFIAQSDSLYRPVFDVVGPVTLPHNRAYYGANNSAGSDQNPAQMTVDACRLVDGEVDFTRYDNNNDGEIDFVYVLFAGIGENDRNGEAEAIWPHNFYAGSKNCWLDGKKLNNYACSGEVDGLTGLRNGIGTLCHEFSHVLGLPDYYDTSSSGYNSTHILTPNDWSIMDYGCYNNGGNTPPNYSIFDKYFLGWATPALLAEGAQLNVSLGTAYDEGYQINGGTTLLPYSTTQTVYYIENRQQQGWDAYLPGHGMLVWQVKYNKSAWAGNTPNSTANDPRYTVVTADDDVKVGDYISDGVVYHEGKTDPFPGFAQVTSYTPFANCALSDITETAGVISFLYNGGAPTDQTDVESVQPSATGVQKQFRNGQLVIVRDNKTYNALGILIQ